MEERCQKKGREKEVLDNGGGSGVSSSGASNIVISKDGEPLPSIVLVNQHCLKLLYVHIIFYLIGRKSNKTARSY
jgi:hypothetical protein